MFYWGVDVGDVYRLLHTTELIHLSLFLTDSKVNFRTWCSAVKSHGAQKSASPLPNSFLPTSMITKEQQRWSVTS